MIERNMLYILLIRFKLFKYECKQVTYSAREKNTHTHTARDDRMKKTKKKEKKNK